MFAQVNIMAKNFSLNYIVGITHDIHFAISITFLLSPLWILSFFYKRIALIAIQVVVFVLGFISWILSEYYLASYLPLDHSILVYPLKEIIEIVHSSAGFSVGQVFRGTVLLFLGFLFSWLFLWRIKVRGIISLVFIFLALIPVFLEKKFNPSILNFEKDEYFYQQVNKTAFLVNEVKTYINESLKFDDYDIEIVAREFHKIQQDADYLSIKYSFMRKASKNDVIGQYFNFKEELPNIVFIIVESLSREFSGPNPTKGSFTPFLDSLSQHSLYWSNFLSTSERTFGVLPSSLASLPYGEQGFTHLTKGNKPYPKFISITGMLKDIGYHNSFFYGGWAYFDYMSVFLNESGVNLALTINSFDEKYAKIQENKDGFTWGYPDRALFQNALERLDTMDQKPRFDIYLTLSTHEPFFPPNKEYWEFKVDERLKLFELNETQKAFYERMKLRFATVMYADDAIKEFFTNYKKRPDFENTIFFIFGDHFLSVGETNPLRKYHVPFIVYSPMLNKRKVFPAVSSTADIPPTIANMMGENFNVETPRWVHWLGFPLDTCSQFRSDRMIPFMRVNRNIDEFLWQDHFISRGRLYKIDENLQIIMVENDSIKQDLECKLELFKALNDYVCKHNVIMAPELSRRK
jgi:uncharacterized sulfatase